MPEPIFYPEPALCPQVLQDSLMRYATGRIATGGFLRAVLCNDLRLAVCHGDYDNLPLLPHIVGFVMEMMPPESWGNEERVDRWLAQAGGQS